MLSDFVEKLVEMSNDYCELDGRQFSTRKLYPICPAQPDSLRVHTLEGIVEYYEPPLEKADDTDDDDERRREYPAPAFAHVEDYRTVHLVSAQYGAEKQRDRFVTAQAYEIKHRFGENLSLEAFIVWLQSCFVQDENAKAVLRVVGNIEQSATAEYVDDGVTQRVTARAGVTRREIVDLPNPVELRPYRTFPDIEQPASRFILRITPGKDGEEPRCALHEADGGAWRNQAVRNIKLYLNDNEVPVIG